MLETLALLAATAAAAYVIRTTVNWIFRPRGAATAKPNYDEKLLRPEDKEMIKGTQEIFRNQFGDDMLTAVQNMNAEQRLQTLEPLISELIKLYGLPDIEIELFNERSGLMGGYDRTKNTLFLNIRYLMVNDKECIREFYDTIIHELRHAVQAQMVTTPGFWGADPDLRARLAYNFNHYIRSNKDPQGYMNQLIEQDAFTFAYYTMEGICNA